MKLKLAKKKLFEGFEIECYEDVSREDGDFFMTRKQIGEALQYENLNSFHKVIQRNKEKIGEPVMDFLSTTDNKTYETEVYTFKQLFQILRFSKQPKADLFMDWATLTLQELINGRAELKFKKQEDKDKYEENIKHIVEEAIQQSTKPLYDKIDEQGKVIYLLSEKVDSISFQQPVRKEDIFEYKLRRFCDATNTNCGSYAYFWFYKHFENWLGYKIDDRKSIKETTKDYVKNNLLDEMSYFVDGLLQNRIVKSEDFIYDKARKEFIKGKYIDLDGVFNNNIEWNKILEEFNHECAYCGVTDKPLIAEHVLSKTRMARRNPKLINLINNIVPTCKECNGSKDNINVEEWYPQQESYSDEKFDKIHNHFKTYKIDENKLEKVKLKIVEN